MNRASAIERRFILDQLGKQSQEVVTRLWDAANRFEDVDFFKFITENFPDIAIGYHQIAAEYAATWFEYEFPDIRAITAEALAAEKLIKSAEWALGANGRDALDRLNGTMQRAIYDGDRDTTTLNATNNNLRWVRVARPDACAFCRLLASRSTSKDDLYRSEESALRVVGRSVSLSIADRRMIRSGLMSREEALARRDQMATTYQIGRRRGTAQGRRLRSEESASKTKNPQQLGEKYHDFCHCTAQAIPLGADPIKYLYQVEPDAAFLAEQWNNEYIKARQTAESGDVRKILAAWRQQGVS